MNENPVLTVKLNFSDIQILQDIISNSIPNYKFSVVTQFVGSLNKQLQDELRKIQEVDAPPVVVDTPKNGIGAE